MMMSFKEGWKNGLSSKKVQKRKTNMKTIMMIAIACMTMVASAGTVYVSVIPMDGVACGIIGTPTTESYDEALYKDAVELKQKIPHNLKNTSWSIRLSKKLISEIQNTPKDDAKKVDSLRKSLNVIKRQAKMNGVKI